MAVASDCREIHLVNSSMSRNSDSQFLPIWSVLFDLKRRDCRKSRQVKISLMERATLRVWQWTKGQKDPIIQHRRSQLIKPNNFRLFSAMRAYEVEIISNRQSASDVEFIWQALHSLPVRPEMPLEAQWIFTVFLVGKWKKASLWSDAWVKS